ncbi:hypothetical protein LSH36_473g01035 [Paralvinella palmiformis]|uniref:Uncharacterized protein n=1 Tax=Paralvinella palmiformis TaxID=53620 RepID=A0AAD9J9Y0_9ANNE|nr:hypothetical protein LSH36_473g01035 [Paralvinella palmiformis]
MSVMTVMLTTSMSRGVHHVGACPSPRRKTNPKNLQYRQYSGLDVIRPGFATWVTFHEKIPYLAYSLGKGNSMDDAVLYSCHTGLDIVDPESQRPDDPGETYHEHYSIYQSCSLTSTLRINEGDHISLRQSNIRQTISADEQDSFWGAYFRSAVDNLSFQIRVNNITQFTCKAAGHIGSDVIEEQSFVRHVPTWGCSTGGLTQVSRGDRIILWNRYIYPILMEPSATYWGIIGINTS